MSCILRAGGTDFDVTEFMRGSRWAPEAVFESGEARSTISRPNGKKNYRSGLNVLVSDAPFEDLGTQILQAIDFLEKNREETKRLRSFGGVERVGLDFGIRDRDSAAQCDCFPSRLLLILGELDL